MNGERDVFVVVLAEHELGRGDAVIIVKATRQRGPDGARYASVHLPRPRGEPSAS